MPSRGIPERHVWILMCGDVVGFQLPAAKKNTLPKGLSFLLGML